MDKVEACWVLYNGSRADDLVPTEYQSENMRAEMLRNCWDAVKEEMAKREADGADRPKLYERIKELATDAANTDGAHHKQWYLEVIYATVTDQTYEDAVVDLYGEKLDYRRGIAP